MKSSYSDLGVSLWLQRISRLTYRYSIRIHSR
jgi:hypothetical protein